MTIRVFIVDDSAVVRKHLGEMLAAGGIDVVGSAADPLFAWQRMQAGPWPDVIVLDVEMPRMDGITFLRQLMAERPTPVVMCSTLTEKGAQTTMQALAAGAVAFVTKPKMGLRDFMADPDNGLVEAVQAAARARVAALRPAMPGTGAGTGTAAGAASARAGATLAGPDAPRAAGKPGAASAGGGAAAAAFSPTPLPPPRTPTGVAGAIAARIVAPTGGTTASARAQAAGAAPTLAGRPGSRPQPGAARPAFGGSASVPATALPTMPRAPFPHAGARRTGSALPADDGPGAMAVTTDRFVAIGLSTGGVQAIEAVLQGLDATCPGIVMVQHMPPGFTEALARRLDEHYAPTVREAREGDRILPGTVLIAPGGRHMRVRRSVAQYVVEVRDGPLINHHRPSVDVLLKSVAQCAGANAVGIVMTGMGDDGARGLLEMRKAGARTAAQDEATSVVFGMPAEAIRLGGAQDVLPLGRIAGWLVQAAARAEVAGECT